MDKVKHTRASVILGENKAISALTFETEGERLDIGAIFHIPVRQEGPKTFYKAIACKVQITKEQRAEIVKMLGGVMFEAVTEDPAIKDPDPLV